MTTDYIRASIKAKSKYYPEITIEGHAVLCQDERKEAVFMGTWVRKLIDSKWYRIFVFDYCYVNPLRPQTVVETTINRITHAAVMIQLFYKSPIPNVDEVDHLQITEEERLNPIK